MLYHYRSQRVAVLAFAIGLVATVLLKLAVPVFSLPISWPPLPRTEIRGVWLTNVDSDVLLDRDAMSRGLDQLQDLNFNTLYPAVWNWGYTLYPSQVAEATLGYAVDPRSPSLQEEDALATLITAAHQRSFAVLPWFEFGFMTTAESELAANHPDWLTQRRDGSRLWQEGIYQRLWLNPFKPEVQQFILGLIREIVTNYEIDGIQFDDHFGLPAEFGYDAYTVALYRQEHRNQLPPASSADPEWIRWRSGKITAFMTQVFAEIKAHKENAIVSLSPNTYSYALNHFLQDWRYWERRGLVEELILQLYSSDLDHFTAALARPEVQAARQHIPTGVAILTGLKDLPVPMQQVQSQVRLVRDRRFAGVSFFFYETLWNLCNEPPQSRQEMIRSLFPLAITRPNIKQGWRPIASGQQQIGSNQPLLES